jgi:hypothetical protein
MEALIVLLIVGGLGVAATLAGADSAPGIDDEPHRSI